MKKIHLNRGRNVINIEEIQTYLSRFSQEQQLTEAIDSWLQKTFVRWLVNYFTEIQEVETLAQYKALVKGEVPDWFRPYSSTTFIYIHIKNPIFVDTLNTCVEFLSSRNTKISHKFPRMTVEHVIEKSRQEHLRMQKRQRKYIETSGEALAHIFTFGHLHVVKFLPHHQELALEMARESALMQHCLGQFDSVEKAEGGYGSYYFGLIQREEIALYSLRDEKNMPHATIAVGSKRGVPWLSQIKGKQNRPPVARYVPTCVAFFNHLGVQHNYHPDCLAMGVVFVQGRSEELSKIEDESIQQHLIAYNPAFVHQLPKLSKSSLWLAALRNPVDIATLEGSSDAMKIASLIQHPLLMNGVSFSSGLKGKHILQQREVYRIGNRTFKFPKLEVTRI